jgi:hypothetical protein
MKKADSTTNTPIVRNPEERLLLHPCGPTTATTTRVEAIQSTTSAAMRWLQDAVWNGSSAAGTWSG